MRNIDKITLGIKYIAMAVLIGIIVGIVDTIFGRGLLAISDFRTTNYNYLIPFLPIAGLFIVWMYSYFSKVSLKGMTLVFEAGQNKQFKNVIGVLFPSSLTPVMLELGGISPEKKIHDISREERMHFEELVKAFPFTINGMGEYKEAVITRGGVSVKDIQPGTMESRRVKKLYFIGEVLDLDAVTGGYNLQIAWSTAYLAAMALKNE